MVLNLADCVPLALISLNQEGPSVSPVVEDWGQNMRAQFHFKTVKLKVGLSSIRPFIRAAQNTIKWWIDYVSSSLFQLIATIQIDLLYDAVSLIYSSKSHHWGVHPPCYWSSSSFSFHPSIIRDFSKEPGLCIMHPNYDSLRLVICAFSEDFGLICKR